MIVSDKNIHMIKKSKQNYKVFFNFNFFFPNRTRECVGVRLPLFSFLVPIFRLVWLYVYLLYLKLISVLFFFFSCFLAYNSN